MVVEVTNVDWNPITSRRAELSLVDENGNKLQLIDYAGADLSADWTVGHRYRISNCNIAPGGRGQPLTLAPSKRTQIVLLEAAEETASILIIGDTHVGREHHPKTGEQIDPLGAFTTAAEYAINRGVDAVIHVGDIFHESATEVRATLVKQRVFDPLGDAGIPFYYVGGNHRSDSGDSVLRDCSNCSKLDLEGVKVGKDARIFGINHYPLGNLPWDSIRFPQTVSESNSVLVLHQTLRQLSGRGQNSVDLNRISERFSGKLDLVVAGHHHDAKQGDWRGIPVLYTGASAQLSTNKDPMDRVAWLLEFGDSPLVPKRYDIPQ